MWRICGLASSIVAMLAIVAPVMAQDIVIDDIVANDAIYGRVIDLPAAERDRYKVIVYVHTDIWYIHPYAGQGGGKSWTTIGSDGTWTIPTVRREFTADSVAALLVEMDLREPSQVNSLAKIPAAARRILDLLDKEYNEYHGRL